jgi:ketopantoate reductase
MIDETSRSRRQAFSRWESVTICGGGNAAHALAVVASQNFGGVIDWLVSSDDKAELLRQGLSSGGLHSTGVITASADRVRTISADPAEVIPDADVVIITVPAFAHAPVLRRIKPYVSERTAIGCMPTRGGFEFEAAQLAALRESVRPTLFGLQTLPWSTRVTTVGRGVHRRGQGRGRPCRSSDQSRADHRRTTLGDARHTRHCHRQLPRPNHR